MNEMARQNPDPDPEPAAARGRPVRLVLEAVDHPTTQFGQAVDLQRLERAVREILLAVGEDPDREGLADTPRRVARAYRDLLAGQRDDPARHLGRVFAHDAAGDDTVFVRGVAFGSLCEHHLLPFTGRVHVAYLPSRGRVVGLSKIARVVEVYARRLQLQERLAAQVADAIETHLEPRGVAVVVEGQHLCMRIRGVVQHEADMVTTAFRGVLQQSEALRSETMAILLHGGRSV